MTMPQVIAVDRSANRHASVQSRPQRAVWHSDYSRQLGNGDVLSVPMHPHIPARVRGLFGARSPSAVVRFVIAIVVDAINRVMDRRTRPHISEEQSKIAPSFTDGNSSTSPFRILGMSLVQATLTHGQPRRVLNASIADGMSMRALSVSDPSSAHATARACSTSFDIVRLRGDGSATIAAKLPMALANAPHSRKQPKPVIRFHLEHSITVGHL